MGECSCRYARNEHSQRGFGHPDFRRNPKLFVTSLGICGIEVQRLAASIISTHVTCVPSLVYLLDELAVARRQKENGERMN